MGSELAILAVDQTKLQLSETAGTEALTRLQEAHCDNEDQERAFADFMKRAHSIVKDLEDERETMVRPLLDSKSEIDALYKAARTPWERVKAVCKLKIANAQMYRRKLEDEARALAVQAAQEGNQAAFATAVHSLGEHIAQSTGASVTWEWVVKSFRKGEMPLEYLVPDLDAIKLVCRRHKNSERPPVIQGVLFERSAHVGVR